MFEIIAEKINGTRKTVGAAILARDTAFVQDLAVRQAAAGATWIDVNAGTSPDREADDLAWLVETVQAVTDVPLSIDSSNPRAIEAALGRVARTPLVNSISGERSRLEGVLPLVAAAGSPVVALALDDHGIPAGVEDRSRRDPRAGRGDPCRRDPRRARLPRPARDDHLDEHRERVDRAGRDAPGAARVPGRPHDVRPVERVLRAPGPEPRQSHLPDPGDLRGARQRDPRSARPRPAGRAARHAAGPRPGPSLPRLHPCVPSGPARGRASRAGAADCRDPDCRDPDSTHLDRGLDGDDTSTETPTAPAQPA